MVLWQTRYCKSASLRNVSYFLLKLAGHSGNFKAGKNQGTVLKKCCPQEENCYKQFHNDSLHDYVPDYQGTLVLDDDESKNDLISSKLDRFCCNNLYKTV